MKLVTSTKVPFVFLLGAAFFFSATFFLGFLAATKTVRKGYVLIEWEVSTENETRYEPFFVTVLVAFALVVFFTVEVPALALVEAAGFFAVVFAADAAVSESVGNEERVNQGQL